MKIFLSWSGPRSKCVATTLRSWLPNVIQAVEPFISSQDIEKGTRGLNTISKHLEESSIGIICLTPENQDKPWILFEAGALSKQATAHVCTFLFDMNWAEVKPPLSSFQHTTYSRDDIKALCKTINAQLSIDRRLSGERLDDAFEMWFPQLESVIQEKMPKREESEAKVEARSDENKLDELLGLVRRLSETRNDTGRKRGRDGTQAELDALISWASMTDSEKRDAMRSLLDTMSMNNRLVPYKWATDQPAYDAALKLGYVTKQLAGGVLRAMLTPDGENWLKAQGN